MIKTRDEFVALIQSLEATSARDTTAYRLRLGALAVLGYAYIAFVLLVLLGLIAGVIALTISIRRFYAGEIKLLIFLGILVFVFIRALWVVIPPPQGIVLTRQQVPALFALLDELFASLRVPHIHRVLLDGDFNAGVVQMPRFGLFGWTVNYLTLGLPLLSAISPEQFTAILAHELGHLSERHGKFSVWIWRARETWDRLQSSLSGEGGGSWLISHFLNWYAPYFHAYAFVLGRAQEYEADRYAAQLTSPATISDALLATVVRDKYLDKAVWDTLLKQMQATAAAPTDIYQRLTGALREPMPGDDAGRWVRLALARNTDYDDTHPALHDRIAALGCGDRLAAPRRCVLRWTPSPPPRRRSVSWASHCRSLPGS
jgi:Zn-dependent protease with chaperone function